MQQIKIFESGSLALILAASPSPSTIVFIKCARTLYSILGRVLHRKREDLELIYAAKLRVHAQMLLVEALA